MAILIAGGAGYIGSHTCLQLLQAGHEIVVLNNLSNSLLESLNRVKQISGKTIAFVQGDIRDIAAMQALFKAHRMNAVVHFARLNAFVKVSGKPVPYEFLPRRAGDVAINYANTPQALLMLGWKASHNLEAMPADAWKWQSYNPNGYTQSV